MLKQFILTIALIMPGTAIAADSVSLSSIVFVERKVAKPNGTTAMVLEKPTTVIPGDNLVFVVKYKNVGTEPAVDFSVTNPLPEAVAFNGTSDGREIVSVDGGNTWGPLSDLTYQSANGDVRPALMADVTHIKWKFNRSISAGSEGELVFRGTVK
ncbi:hypothetical protein [Parasphingorhabdus sp.]|uniref:hypothetical protein n=1 Tax=Parasphingorhabdus sp. TaxID=2709688 RepID=UPI0032635CB5